MTFLARIGDFGPASRPQPRWSNTRPSSIRKCLELADANVDAEQSRVLVWVRRFSERISNQIAFPSVPGLPLRVTVLRLGPVVEKIAEAGHRGRRRPWSMPSCQPASHLARHVQPSFVLHG